MPSPSVALLRTQSDTRLVALAAAGHERAFEAIVERYRRALLRHARRYLPEARAEDAVQQALVAAWTALRRGDAVHDLRPWLYRIVHNAALNVLRTPGYDYEELRATLQGDGGPADLAERRAVVRGTLAGLAALPERQREALLRIAVEGRSQDEVAEQLGLSQGAVRQLVHRARTTLRAAATAVVPLPLASWLATAGAGRGDVALRVGELVAGAGGGATLAKAGAVAVLAGGAVAAPTVVHDVSDREQRAVAKPPARAEARSTRAAPTPAPPAAPVLVEAPRDAPAQREDAGGSGSDGGGARGGDGRRDDGTRGRRDDERGSGGRDDRGPGGDEERSRGDDDTEPREGAPRSRRGDRWDDDGSRGEDGGDDDGRRSEDDDHGAQRTGDGPGDDDGGARRTGDGESDEDGGDVAPRLSDDQEDGDDDSEPTPRGGDGDDDADRLGGDDREHDGDGATPAEDDGVAQRDDAGVKQYDDDGSDDD